MSRNAYQARLQQHLDQMARRTKERKEEHMLRADKVVRQYVDAYTGYHGEAPNKHPDYSADTGYYTLYGGHKPKRISEKVLTAATDWYYAATHERELQGEEV